MVNEKLTGAGSGLPKVSVRLANVTVTVVAAAKSVAEVSVIELPLADRAAVKSVRAVVPSITVNEPATLAGARAVLQKAWIRAGLRGTPVPPSSGDDEVMRMTSVPKVRRLRSPGAQSAFGSPPSGAQIWMPSLSTTSGAKAIVHEALVGSRPSLRVRRMRAGPSDDSGERPAGTSWLPAGCQNDCSRLSGTSTPSHRIRTWPSIMRVLSGEPFSSSSRTPHGRPFSMHTA